MFVNEELVEKVKFTDDQGVTAHTDAESLKTTLKGENLIKVFMGRR